MSCENSYMPHGDAYKAWKEATAEEQKPVLVGENALSFMFHLNNHFSLTKFALERNPSIKRKCTTRNATIVSNEANPLRRCTWIRG